MTTQRSAMVDSAIIIIPVISEGQRPNSRVYEIFEVSADARTALKTARHRNNVRGIYLTKALQEARATRLPIARYEDGEPIHYKAFVKIGGLYRDKSSRAPLSPELSAFLETPTEWKDVIAALEI